MRLEEFHGVFVQQQAGRVGIAEALRRHADGIGMNRAGDEAEGARGPPPPIDEPTHCVSALLPL